MKPHLDSYIKRMVDAAPPLTAEQRDKLALLLRPLTVDPPRGAGTLGRERATRGG